eukprot:gene1587-32974_t
MATFIAADAAQARIFPGRPTAPLTLDQDHVREQLAALETGTYEQQLGGLGELTRLLEEEEGRFREAAGDPFTTPTVRNGHNIGRLMSMIKESDELYAKVTDDWVLSSRATLLMQVAGLRGANCKRLDTSLCAIAMGNLDHADDVGKTPMLGKFCKHLRRAILQAPAGSHVSLCAIAMGNLDHADDVVKTPMVGKICKHLRRAILQAPAGSDVAENCSKGATEGAGAACASPQAEGSDLNLNLKTMGVQLRQSLVMYCIQLVARLGEYVECLGPLLQEQGVEVQIELLRRYSPEGGCILFDVLDMLCALLAHRRFAEFFVEQGGIPLLLGLPRSQHVYTNQSMALYGLSSLPVVFERVCALGPVIVQQLVSIKRAWLLRVGGAIDPGKKGSSGVSWSDVYPS